MMVTLHLDSYKVPLATTYQCPTTQNSAAMQSAHITAGCNLQ